jgi:hypothetical protein
MLTLGAHVFYSLFLSEKLSVSFSIFNLSGLSIPLVYSFASLIGAFLLLLSTPLGFAKMFDISSKSLFEKEINSSTNLLDFDTTDNREENQSKPCPDSPLTRRLNGPSGDNLRLRNSKLPKAASVIRPLCHAPPQLSRIRRIFKASVGPLLLLFLLVLTVRLYLIFTFYFDV